MSQHSEERADSGSARPPRSGARILPFERPQSELQRAIQQRAQEALDRNRELDAEGRRPKPLKWLTIFAVASIPVLLLFAAVDSFLRVFHKVAETYTAAPPPEQQAPAMPLQDPSQPGVVFLEPYDGRQKSEPAPPPQSPDSPRSR